MESNGRESCLPRLDGPQAGTQSQAFSFPFGSIQNCSLPEAAAMLKKGGNACEKNQRGEGREQM